MAMVTEHLGFGITCTLSFEPPYPFARRMSSLDHLTDGRVGWNIVTGYLNSAARGVSGVDQTGHDTRYEIGDEYMAVMYKLWEGSWEDGAVVRDRNAGIFTHPEKVHKVHHNGKYFHVDAVHLCEPSPQRTPVLYQAGASTKGSGLRLGARRMRLHRRTHKARARPSRRRFAQGSARSRSFRLRFVDFHAPHGDRRLHGRRGSGKTCRVPQLCQPRGCARADGGMDRHRLRRIRPG